MDNTIETVLRARKDASVDAAIQSTKRQLDDLAKAAKAAPLDRKAKIDVNTQDARARINDLQYAIVQMQRRAESGKISVGELSALQQAKAEVKSLESALDGLRNKGAAIKGQGLLGGNPSDLLGSVGLGGLTQLATFAGLGAAAVGIAKTTVELSQLGAQSLDTAKSFENVRRSVDATPELLTKLKDAAGGTITEMRLMQLTNTALAGASDQMGQAFANAIPKLIEGARAANKLNPALGDTEFLFQSLVTGIKRGSPMLIDNTGITLKLGEANEEYARSLGKSADALTEEEKKVALLNATMAGVDRLVEQAGGSLDSMSSKTQQLTTATTELGTALGKLTAKPYTVVVEYITKQVGGLANDVNTVAGLVSDNPSERLTATLTKLENAKRTLAELQSGKGFEAFAGRVLNTTAMDAQLLTLEIQRLEQEIAKLRGTTDSGKASMLSINTAIQNVGVGIGGVHSVLAQGDLYWDGWAGAAERAAIATANAVRQVQATTTGTFTEPSKTRWGLYAEWGSHFTEQPTSADPVKAWLKRQQDANKTAGRSLQTELDKAYSQSLDRFKGYLQQGMNASIGLKDLRTDLFKPGSNGAFENLYRALDIAVNGTNKSPWDEVLGLDQETARKISQDFQNGIFSPEVMGLVDVDALVNQAKLAELAEKTQAAFAAAIAQKAGVRTNLVSNMFGFGGSSEGGGKADTNAQKQVDEAMSQVSSAIGTTVNGKDFADRMIGFGETIWGGLGKGIVKRAKEDNTLYEAVAAAVATALARQGTTAGSASNAARAQGVPGV